MEIMGGLCRSNSGCNPPSNDKATMSAHYSGMVALFIKLLFQRGHQLVETIQCGLQIFDDIRGQFVGIG